MNLLCVFCGGGDPAWTYPWMDFKIDVMTGSITKKLMVVGACACVTCYDIVEGNDDDKLATHMVNALKLEKEVPESDEELYKQATGFIEKFKRHRYGPAVLIIDLLRGDQ